LKKYGLQKSYQQLNPQTIKQISKKVLLALEFIYSKGLFYGHLHSGNVLIDLANMTNVKLTDLPNALIGVPYLYRSNVVEQRKIQTIELTDVYGLGQLIYEMCYGEAMFNRGVKTNFEDCPNPEIKSILNLLLSEEALAKSTLPTINQLLEMP
jgi:PX domain-containing protein kinase-like protein